MTPLRSRRAGHVPAPVTLAFVRHICTLPIDTLTDLELDHVIPVAHGGTTTYANIRPAHMRCNRRKGAKLLPP